MEELYNILMSDDVETSIRANLKKLLTLIPELKASIGFDQKHPDHIFTVFEHTLYALKLSEPIYEVRLTLLLHDISKPTCYTEGEIRHFHNHPLASSLMSYKILRRLGYDEEFIKEICYYVKNHDTPISASLIEKKKNKAEILYKIQYCDALAHNPQILGKRIAYLEKTRTRIYENN